MRRSSISRMIGQPINEIRIEALSIPNRNALHGSNAIGPGGLSLTFGLTRYLCAEPGAALWKLHPLVSRLAVRCARPERIFPAS
jgi:hypothetical protein